MLISVGWLPPYLYPSGACLDLGARILNLLTPSRVTPYRGCTSSDGLGNLTWKPLGTLDSGTIQPPYLGDYRNLLGNGPHKRDQLTGNRNYDLIRVFPPCAELPIAFTQADLCLPT